MRELGINTFNATISFPVKDNEEPEILKVFCWHENGKLTIEYLENENGNDKDLSDHFIEIMRHVDIEIGEMVMKVEKIKNLVIIKTVFNYFGNLLLYLNFFDVKCMPSRAT